MVVVVETDLSSPAEVASVRATIGEGGCADLECLHDFATGSSSAFPFSFVVEPRDDPSARFTLSIVARDAGGTTTVSREIETGFVPSSTRLLVVRLSRACRGVSCSLTETCSDGACVGRFVDPEDLPTVLPGRELDGRGDAGPGLDAPEDAPLPDALPFDAPLDAPPRDALGDGGGALPDACSALPAGAPGGLTLIDPDGAGPIAPFEVWCDMTTEGGGWTLLVKADGATSALPYTAPAWTGGPDLATPGPPSITRGNAIYLPYWHVPITELLMGTGTDWFAAPSTEMVPTTARQAMESGVSFSTPRANEVEWASLVPGLNIPTASCRRRGINVHLPSGGEGMDVRIGMAGSAVTDCSEPTFWYGVGATITASGGGCRSSTATAGGARVCGTPASVRGEAAAFLLVYGR